jgi:hypothetical protein
VSQRAYLDEADFLGVAAEALPAAHQPVLPDQAMRVAADTAASATTKNQTTARHKRIKQYKARESWISDTR